jgi:tRNA A37 threonylcarbamoyladenosine dehydratase
MSHELIEANPDLKRLKDEGYAVEVKDSFLLVHEIPYVNSNRKIKYGILVSDLSSMAGNRTTSPVGQHVAYFIGDHPCNSDGSIISAIKHSTNNQSFTKDITVNHSFSNKPQGGYQNYYEKMVSYINIISSQAKAIDDSVTEKPFKTIDSENEEQIFKYVDTNSGKAKIVAIASKLKEQKVAIIGLGGTGSYILDMISKTPVREIHLFDGDLFLQHNAFRSPGASSLGELQALQKKTDYFQTHYSNIRTNIISHNYYIDNQNIDELLVMNFVFICIDKSDIKKVIIDNLVSHGISFIDTGIGVINIDDSLIGHIRVTTSTPDMREHIKTRIAFNDDGGKNDYSTNIQIAELNALNAALAVIKWKKLFGYYQDQSKEFNSVYSINDGVLINEDNFVCIC